MADFVKKKILEKLARFTKNLKPSDITLSFLKGKGELNNLDLDAQVISSILRLPPWIQVRSVYCDQIKIDVPFTDLHKSPLRCILGQVNIEVSTCDDDDDNDGRQTDIDLMKLASSSNPSSYGLTDKIIDGMRVEIRSILVSFKNPVFEAKLEINDVIIESTTPEWQPAILPLCRYKNEDEGAIIIYKKCTWNSFKIEGSGIVEGGKDKRIPQLRLLTDLTEIRATIKRRMSDCKVLYTRISVNLGDLVWVLTQEQLKAASMLVQSLTDAAVKSNQRERAKVRSSKESLDSIESVSSTTSGGRRDEESRPKKIKRAKSPLKDNKEMQREMGIRNREVKYQLGKMSLPSYEVIQDSIHIKTGKLNIQLCDDHGNLLLEVNKLIVDIYPDQTATSGRYHWNKSNIRLQENTDWSSDLVKRADKIQHVDLPSVSLYHLRERGFVVRCEDFSIKSISERGEEELLPIISCDKKTFSLPNDVENPAFQCGITMYYYPVELGHKFLVPRPNVFIYLSPLHVNFHQKLCLWLVEFVHGVARTVNLNLLMSAHIEGQEFLEQIKAKQDAVKQLPGIDMKFYIPYSKVTLPLVESYTDGRPRALQLETGGIYLQNHTLLSLLSDSEFLSAWQKSTNGWLPTMCGQFPHNPNDPSPVPKILIDLIEKELKSQKPTPLPPSKSHSTIHLKPGSSHPSSREGRRSAPDISHHKISLHQLNLATMECWYAHTRCVSLAFVSDLSHEATLYAQEFITDFPLHVWVFQPKKMAEMLASTISPSPSPSLSSPLPSSVPPSSSTLPLIHIIAHTSQEVTVKLERLHFLFLMRFKDSLQGFKNTLMKFLSIQSIIESQSEAFQIQQEEDEDLKEKLSATFKHPSSPNSPETLESRVTANINLEEIKVFVGLPSMGPVMKSPAVTNPVSPNLSLTQSQCIKSQAIPKTPPNGCNVPSIMVTSPTTPFDHTHKTQSMPVLTPQGSQLSHDISLSTSELQSLQENVQESEGFILVDTIDSSLMDSYPVSPRQLESISPSSLCMGTEEGKEEIFSSENDILESQNSNSDDILLTTEEEFSSENDNLETESQNNKIDETLLNTESKTSHLLTSSTTSLYSPVHTLYVQTGIVRVLLSLSGDGIAVRATLDSIDLSEITDEEVKQIQSQRPKQYQERDSTCLPVIKARVEIGNSAEKYFPNVETQTLPDGVIFLKLSGLKPVLSIKNLMVTKDFFDDEIVSKNPIPLQLRVMETQFVLKDSFSLPVSNPRTITLNIADLFINRGPRVEGTNLIHFSEGLSTRTKTDDKCLDTPFTSDTNTTLLDSFQRFIDAFQAHTAHKGEVNIPQPDKISKLLEELQNTLTSPPAYTEAISCDFYTNITSSSPHPTIDSLRAEVENLKIENQKLLMDLTSVQKTQEETEEDRDYVTTQLVDTKVKLASAHLVLEQQLIRMERLYTENCMLKDKHGETD